MSQKRTQIHVKSTHSHIHRHQYNKLESLGRRSWNQLHRILMLERDGLTKNICKKVMKTKGTKTQTELKRVNS